MRGLLLAAGLVLLAVPASAKEWVVDYSQSKLGFIGVQGTSSFEGTFGKFETHIDFDPDHPETGKITANIDMASATAGNTERDSVLPGSDWFDTKKFPQAEFVSAKIYKSGQTYKVDGSLTIKGISQPVTLVFTLEQAGEKWHAQLRTTLLRNNFNIGIGQWANENYVKYAVDVVGDISAKPAS